MQAQSTQKVRTFSIGFHEQGYNEAHHAKNVADHLGTDHTELYVTPTDAQNVIPKLGHMFDEPFADSSQIPTYLVSAMTKQHVTVALSGDGGDELFCGYSRYFAAARMGQKVFSKPYALRRIAAGMLHMLPPAAWDACGKIIPASKRPAHFGDRLHKLADLLPGKQDDFFQRTLSHWDTPAAIARHGAELNTVLFDPTLVQSIPDFYQRMQYIDTLMYLPDDILTKVDRTSMAVSLEARVPLLDHRVVELSWRLPHAMKVRHGQGKWALKNILYRYVPQDIIDRPKMGFGVPVGDWIKAPLRDWAENLLSEETLNKHGLVNTAEVRRRWQEHLHSQRNWQAGLWNILMLQSWAEEWN
jgi:asparagine synthase (glutamine-hydrolysing)